MGLGLYNGTPFASSNLVTPDDTFVSDGVTTTYTLVNKTVSQLGSTIQAGNVEYYQYNGGFTTNVGLGTFTLSSAPVAGTQIVAPGVIQAVIAAFDQPVVLGVVNPRVQSVPLWLVDPLTINNFKYEPLPSYPGLQISMVNLISGANAQISWIQFASADASGNALTYGATGAPLYLPPLDGFTTFSASASSSQVTLSVASTAGFWAGQYVSLNIGGSSQEVVHVISLASPTAINLDPTGCTFPHYSGEIVYACGWKFWAQATIPVNANNNTPVNLYNLGLQRLGAIRARP